MRDSDAIMRIEVEAEYSVSQAARFLGVHRCTIYDYIRHPERPLPFIHQEGGVRLMFKGADLLAYKAAGLPKRGRRRKTVRESND